MEASLSLCGLRSQGLTTTIYLSLHCPIITIGWFSTHIDSYTNKTAWTNADKSHFLILFTCWTFSVSSEGTFLTLSQLRKCYTCPRWEGIASHRLASYDSHLPWDKITRPIGVQSISPCETTVCYTVLDRPTLDATSTTTNEKPLSHLPLVWAWVKQKRVAFACDFISDLVSATSCHSMSFVPPYLSPYCHSSPFFSLWVYHGE